MIRVEKDTAKVGITTDADDSRLPSKSKGERRDGAGDEFGVGDGATSAEFAANQAKEVKGVGRKTTAGPQSEFAKELAATPRGVVVFREYGKVAIAKNGELDAQTTQAGDFRRLAGLTSRDRPTVVNAASRVGGPFSIVLPPNFDPTKSYRARTVASPPKELGELVNKLVGSKSNSYLGNDEILVVLDAGKIGKWDPVEVAQSRLKPFSGLDITGWTGATALEGPPRGWSAAIKAAKTSAPKTKPKTEAAAPKGDDGSAVRQRAVARARDDLLQRLGGLPASTPGLEGLVELIQSRIPAETKKTGDDLDKLEGAVRRYEHLVEQFQDRHGAAVEKVAAPVVERPPTKVSKTDQKLLDGIVKTHKGLAEAIELVVAQRPDLFAGKDAVTGKTFAKALAEFVDGGYAKRTSVAGFARFIARVAEQRFDGHVPYYSHTHGVNKELVVNHPGLILSIIQAAMDDKPFETEGAYPKDGRRDLPPMEEFKKPFERSYGRGFSDAILGYERGLLKATVEVLAPKKGEVHPDLVYGRSPMAAVSFQKLTGLKIRYNYAFGLHTGEDLVAALEASAPRGIAMGDVDITWESGGGARPHFPYFSDYDPNTKTVRLDNFGGGVHRVPVEGMRLHKVALYHYSDGALDRFLTPDKETKMGDKHPGLKKNKRPALD